MAKLLIVEDDQVLNSGLRDFFLSEGHKVDAVNNGLDAVEYLKSFEYDVLILDWELPDKSGVEILNGFRASGGKTPALMLTGKSAINEKERGFQVGADDYLTKPFNMKELAMRVMALLRRPAAYTGSIIKIRQYEFDISNRRLLCEGREIVLQPMEYTLLELLMRNPDHVFSVEVIIKRCWGSDDEISIESLYSCVKRLRKKIDVKGQASLITTVHGIGYRLDSK